MLARTIHAASSHAICPCPAVALRRHFALSTSLHARRRMTVIGNDGRDLVTYLLLIIPLEFIMTSKRLNQGGDRRTAAMIAGGILLTLSSCLSFLLLLQCFQVSLTPLTAALEQMKELARR